MLFKNEHIQMILDGKKTQTRRTWKVCKVKVGGLYKCKKELLSKDCFAKIKVNKLFKQKLCDMSEEDAIKEGYSSKKDYFDVFQKIYKIDPLTYDNEVYVVEFELVKGDSESPKPSE